MRGLYPGLAGAPIGAIVVDGSRVSLMCALRRLASLLLLLAGLVFPGAAAAEDWVRVRSKHFEVLSDATPEKARAIAVRLEQFRRVLASVLRREESVEPPTVVIAFRDQGSFAPFLPLYQGRGLDVEGYFQAGPDTDYIAASIGSALADPYET